MATTREKILQTLLDNPRSTIKALADAVTINAISVRHHLASLQADGLVTSEEERHGVGRPRLVYSLTKKGTEIFPSNYLELTDRLLLELHETMEPEELTGVFVRMADRQINELRPDLSGLKTPRERVEYLVERLEEGGHSITWQENQDGEFRLEVANCPYLHISQAHPVVCAYDEHLFREVLDMDTVKLSSICAGDRVCCYLAKPKK
ncbi:MAG: winged helix-turn-helix transcriptional regulator [Anaerolineae bacterium]|jgi:predicted ArsR family transcriptional regulator|nr:winged helix-turn-helix transcriptional regulator [Anaerolineae bacterium]